MISAIYARTSQDPASAARGARPTRHRLLAAVAEQSTRVTSSRRCGQRGGVDLFSVRSFVDICSTEPQTVAG
jgi:hypothetical protein